MAKDPLDRLRKRSAERDWKRLQERYQEDSEPMVLPSMPVSPMEGTVVAPAPISKAPVQSSPSPTKGNLAATPLSPEEFETFRTSQATPLFEDYLPSHPAPQAQAGVMNNAQPAPMSEGEMFFEPKPVVQRDRIPVLTTSVSSQPSSSNNFLLPGFREPETDPSQMAKVTTISPFSTYEPDPELRANDPLRNICLPCPDCDPDKRLYECPEIYFSERGSLERAFSNTDFQWTASNLMYNPLYFQDVGLERYGHDHHPLIQPAMSVGLFMGQFLALPYQLAMHPVCDEEYPLGYYRPGEPTPRMIYQVPLNAKAAAVTGGVYTGLFFIIP